MKWAVISAALLGVAGASPTHAQAPVGPWIAPAYQALRAVWPKDASGRFVYGSVRLSCAVGRDSKAADCMVLSTTPDSPELSDAAPRLASLFTASAPGQNGREDLAIRMDVDTFPGFVHTPNGNDIARVYPPDARQRRLAGVGLLHCWIKTDGRLRDCEVKSETPPGRGFGDAALKLAPIVLMKPAMREGKPVETEVTMPMRFMLSAF